MGMGFAAVSCSHHWTPMCGAIQARAEAALPYTPAVLALALLAFVWVLVRGAQR